jgi:hypothetical protein
MVPALVLEPFGYVASWLIRFHVVGVGVNVSYDFVDGPNARIGLRNILSRVHFMLAIFG